MAVRTKDEKNRETIFSLFSFFGDTKPVIEKLFKLTLLTGFVIVCVLLFNTVKQAVFEQWKVTEISINHNLKQVEPRQIAQILEKDEFAYLLQIDVVSLQNEIKNLEWVKQVEIRKKWPNTIEIILEEYIPIARINEHILIDSGILIMANSLEQFSHLPMINFRNDTKKFNYLELIEQLNKIQSNLGQVGVSIESLNISENFSWTINTSKELEIKLGRKLPLLRIERLISSLSFIDDLERVKTIDLRYNNGFAVSRKNELKDVEKLPG